MADNVSIQGLEFEIVENSSSAIQSLERLKNTLVNLRSATKGGASGIATTARQITKLNTALATIPANVSKLHSLAEGMRAISSVSNLKLSSSFSRQISQVGDALGKIQWNDGGKLTMLANGLRPLTTLGKSNLATLLNQLKKLPEIIRSLDDVDLNAFSAKIRKVADSLRPLANEMAKVSSGFAQFPSKIQGLISSSERYNMASTKMTTSTTHMGRAFGAIKFSLMYIAVRRVAHAIGYAVTKSNEFIENMNLFTVSMGEYAKEAYEYGETVRDVLGIDLSEWIRNQGIFNTLLTGFGNVSSRAATMSKNLTQLGYDLSSFFNIPVADAMQKLQSGISGELEPLRRLGYDLSQARLEMTALNLGIEKHVSDMTQAEKAELRYYTIMNQVKSAQGDLSRTLDAPANQLRILKAQFVMAAQAIGNIFIPALNAILPYAIAVVNVIRQIANAIASLFGFSMPEVDYSGIKSAAGGAEDLKDNLGGAAGAAKKLKDYTLGIDELNVFNPDKGGGGGGGGAAGGEGFDFELPEYDFLGDAIQTRVDNIIANLKAKMEELKEAFAGLKEIDTSKLVKSLENLMKPLSRFSKAIWDGLLWGIENVFVPLSGFVIEDVLPTFLDTLASSINIVSSVIEGSGDLFVSFYDNFLRPLAEFTEPIVADILHDISDEMKALDEAFDNSEVWADLKTILEEISEIFLPLVEAFVSLQLAVLKFKIGTGFSILKTILSDIEDVIGAVAAIIRGDFADAWEHFKDYMVDNKVDVAIDALTKLKTNIESYSARSAEIVDSLKKIVEEAVNNWKETIRSWWEDDVKPWFTLEKWEEVFHNIGKAMGTSLTGGLGLIETWKTNITSWWEGDVKPWFTFNKWSELFSSIGEAFVEEFKGENGFVNVWKNRISSWWENDVKPWFTLEKWLELGKNMKEGLIRGITDAIGNIALLFENLIKGIKETFKNPFDTSYDDPLRGHTGGGVNKGIPKRANGGYVDHGELFLAREAGAEMVGAIGRKTAVANNDQIVEAVSSGVTVANDGVIAAIYNLIGAVEAKNLSVSIGDNQIGESYDRYSLSRGVSVNEGAFANAY